MLIIKRSLRGCGIANFDLKKLKGKVKPCSSNETEREQSNSEEINAIKNIESRGENQIILLASSLVSVIK